MHCGLCREQNLIPYFHDQKRQWQYFVCETCDFLFRDPETYLNPIEEKKRYTTHNNSIENEGYVKFLSPVLDVLKPYLGQDSQGLDYGSGPGPILDILFGRESIKVCNFDPYFDNDPNLLDRTWDFVTCTEVFEHFYEPAREMDRITPILKPKGFLLLMTEMRQGLEHFQSWGYRTDNTHVGFLNSKSLQWLGERWNYEILSSDGRISLLQKKS